MKISVQAVILNKKGEVLCVSRKSDHNDFGLVGGKMDDTDKSTIDALYREVKEETGLDINSYELICMGVYNEYMSYTYLVTTTGKISYNEPHVVKWGTFYDLIKGSFGEYNYQIMKILQIKNIYFK